MKPAKLTILIITVMATAVVISGCVKKPQVVIPVETGIHEQNTVATSTATSTVNEVDTSDWKTYRNEEYGFEFKYPTNFYLRDSNNISSVICEEGKDVRIYCIYSWIMDVSPDLVNSFKNYAVEEVKLRCTADGSRGSVYCNDVISVESIKVNGIEGYQITLKQVEENYINQTRQESNKNPIYVLKLSTISKGVVGLFIEPFNNVPEDDFRNYLFTIKNILTTVQIKQ